jgi:hypothetical protein
MKFYVKAENTRKLKNISLGVDLIEDDERDASGSESRKKRKSNKRLLDVGGELHSPLSPNSFWSTVFYISIRRRKRNEKEKEIRSNS